MGETHADAQNPPSEAGPPQPQTMRAARYARYGGPEVIETATVDAPHPAPGQVRVAVRAASVNVFDLKKRSGMFSGDAAPPSPVIPGVEAAGVVDEVGEKTSGVAVGEAVFGLGSATSAEHAVLEHWAPVPPVWNWAQAASVSTAAEAARRALDLLGVREGHLLLIDGAAGSVGTAAAQFAIDAGLSVVGTASVEKHDRLRELGVAPVTYGSGLAGRVAQVATGGVDRVLDASGRGSLDDLIEIAGSPDSVITVANFDAPDKGVRVTSKPVAFHALGTAANLAADGRFAVAVDSTYPLADAPAAHARAEAGSDGKVVVLP